MGYRTLRRRERRFVRTAAAGCGSAAVRLYLAVGAAARILGSKFTVIVLPQDHRPAFQFSCSFGGFLLLTLLLIDGVFAVPALRLGAARADDRALSASSILDQRLSDYDELRDGVAGLVADAAPLTEALRKMNGTLAGMSGTDRRSGKDLLAIFGIAGRGSAGAGEAAALASLRRTIESSTDTLREAGRAVGNLRENLAEVPVLWPIAGGIGHVSMFFGPNPNPFTGVPYMHLGLDIGNYRDGDPIVATADGTVVAAYYDSVSGYGNNVTIQHLHGYYTRYGHLQTIKVRVGEEVLRGRVIGMLGHTGRVDGPHVHYEIRLGPTLMDPLPMIARRTRRGTDRS